METIHTYLENMFKHLPNNEEVRHAKEELNQMMEDKYNELIAEGRTENEAVGVVISEFGNLEELSEVLGIRASAEQYETEEQKRIVSVDEAKDYLNGQKSRAFKIAMGVLLCIISPVGYIILDMFDSKQDILGLLFMIATIVAGVVLFVLAGVITEKWNYLMDENCCLDFNALAEVKEMKRDSRAMYAVLNTMGIVLCIISFIPAAIIDELNIVSLKYDLDNVGGAGVLVFVAVGVFMIVYANTVKGSFDRLINIDKQRSRVQKGDHMHTKERYTSKTVANIMSVYWPTITCIYLCYSFLTFRWWRSWLIWPIAAVVCSLIKNIYREED